METETLHIVFNEVTNSWRYVNGVWELGDVYTAMIPVDKDQSPFVTLECKKSMTETSARLDDGNNDMRN